MAEFLVIDTETSGMINRDVPADHEWQPRLASWCMIWLDRDLEIQNQLDGLVRRDGWSMSPGATKVNGITDERLDAEGATVLWPLSLYERAADQGRIVVAHNTWFDLKIMRGELRRVGRSDRVERTRSICTMKTLTDHCALPGRIGFKWPTMTEALKIVLGETHESAHGAVADAQGCARLLRAIRDLKLRLVS
jgi:DNA polymerase III subunit epsilon